MMCFMYTHRAMVFSFGYQSVHNGYVLIFISLLIFHRSLEWKVMPLSDLPKTLKHLSTSELLEVVSRARLVFSVPPDRRLSRKAENQSWPAVDFSSKVWGYMPVTVVMQTFWPKTVESKISEKIIWALVTDFWLISTVWPISGLLQARRFCLFFCLPFWLYILSISCLQACWKMLKGKYKNVLLGGRLLCFDVYCLRKKSYENSVDL